jgi:DNA-binding Xre family transcriptional regulator
MIHRHLDHPKGTPPAQLGAAAIDDLLDRGDLEDWAPLARAVAGEPWGPLSDTILRLCAAHPMYGTSRLWQGYVGACRAATLGRGGASWPAEPPVTTLSELRTARGMSQAAIGAHLGMNQSEVSRLERRRDVRLSTLRSYVEAVGGRLGLLVTLSDGSRQVELIVGATGPRSDPDGADPDD